MRSASSSSFFMEDLENQLKQSLRKVEPDQQFIHHLHDRLTDQESFSIEKRHSLSFGMLLVAASLLSGVLLIWVIRLLRN